MTQQKTAINITNYNDTNYEQDFWADRIYENLIESHYIQLLLDKSVDSLIDVGGGFGRLIPIYESLVNKEMVLFDYSQKLLDSAIEKNSRNQKFKAVQGSFYEMPFPDRSFDGAISIRVIHHVEDVDTYFKEISRILKKDGIFILEYANKRNFLEIVRFYLHKSKLRPFNLKPENRSEKGLTFNFHPLYIAQMLDKYGLAVETQIASSLLRSPFLKRKVGQERLAKIEEKLPVWLKKFAISPSIFLKLRKI